MKRICVYCGSSSGRRPEYQQVAQALAKELVERNLGLVYGGASVGIMGVIADQVLERGSEVIGVIPKSLFEKEVGHLGLTKLHIVADMHERKAMMQELSDGFIALPGGLGTLEELFEMLTWAQLGFHSKPCGALNVKGYYDGLSSFLDHGVQEQFIRKEHRALLLIEEQPQSLLNEFENYQAPQVTKWIKKNPLQKSLK